MAGCRDGCRRMQDWEVLIIFYTVRRRYVTEAASCEYTDGAFVLRGGAVPLARAGCRAWVRGGGGAVKCEDEGAGLRLFFIQ